MAAQGNNKVCPKCFEVNDPAATFCIECGAPLSDDPASEGSDQEVYREITQANLSRIRGDYKQAVDVCLGILKRFPNNGTAHTLLGDIYAEQGELEQAAQWFEMALDLRPESQNDRRKLDAVQRRISEQEAATTAKQLGIPESKPQTQRYVYVMVFLVAIVGIGSFLLGGSIGNRDQNSKPSLIDEPIVVGSRVEPTNDQSKPPEQDPGEGIRPTDGVWNGTTSDQQIAQVLATKYTVGRSLVVVHEDPREPSLQVTARQQADEDLETICVDFARAVFVEFPKFASVSVRVVKGDQVVFAADVTRADFQRTLDERLDPKAMLTRTWTPAAPASGPTG